MALKLEELEEERVVMGEGMSFPVTLDRKGALGLVSTVCFLEMGFFFPSSS